MPARRRRFTLLAIFVGLAAVSGGASAQASAPAIDAPPLATLRTGELTIQGQGFGVPASDSRLVFDDGITSSQILSTSLSVVSWTDAEIAVSLPPGVRTGSVQIVAAGLASAPRDLFIFDYSFQGVPPSQGTHPMPLDVAVAPDGRLWTDEEFHFELKAYSPDPLAAPLAVTVPQHAGGIFAQTMFGDGPTRMSVLGEDVDVDSAGRVWFTQGGGYLYAGPHVNASRIVRYDPASGGIACFNVSTDHAEVMGVLIDDARGLVWFAESGLELGNAITAFQPEAMPSDCQFDPASDPWPPPCPGDVAPGCYRRYALPQSRRGPAHLELDAFGDIWFTQSWANSLGRLSPETGEIIELPMPVAEVTQGPGASVGGFPWQLMFDDNGDLWINEYFDAEIYRLRPSLMAQNDCTSLNAAGDNPCAAEIFDGSDGADGKTVHSLTIADDGKVWFALSGGGDTRLGFVSPAHDDGVAMLPPFNIDGAVTGIAQDPARDTVWFAMFEDRRIGRLDPVTSGGVDTDGDGCADSEETGAFPLAGGRRDPGKAWDFYDVNGDRIVDAADVGMVRQRFSPGGTRPGDLNYDRRAGALPWAPGPPDNRINALDIALVRASFNHSCLALP